MKKCPFCFEEIQDSAIKCRYCKKFLNEEKIEGIDNNKNISEENTALVELFDGIKKEVSADVKISELSSQIEELNKKLTEERAINQSIENAWQKIVSHPIIGEYAILLAQGEEVNITEIEEKDKEIERLLSLVSEGGVVNKNYTSILAKIQYHPAIGKIATDIIEGREIEQNNELICEIEDIYDLQIKLYDDFVKNGIEKHINNVFPLQDNSGEKIDFYLKSVFFKKKYSEDDCVKYKMNYVHNIWMRVEMLNKENGEIKEQDVWLCSALIPTIKKTFLIKGEEKLFNSNTNVVISNIFLKKFQEGIGEIVSKFHLHIKEDDWSNYNPYDFFDTNVVDSLFEKIYEDEEYFLSINKLSKNILVS